MTQFIACKFRPTDTRSFTYINDGEPVAVGNLVKVPDARSDGWKRVEVVAIDVPEPEFACKAIIGLWEPEPEVKPEAPYTIIEKDFLDGLTGDDA